MTSSPDLRSQPKVGLRERKKARTRATIRSEAIRLFSERGYTETTIEQIAEAAEVSPSTFFRYFPTKEAVVLTDEWDPVIIESFRAQPPGVGSIRALRNASMGAFGRLTPEEHAQEEARALLVLRTPELQTATTAGYASSIDLLAGLFAEREGGAPDDLRIRALAGAVTGIVMAVSTEQWKAPGPAPIDDVARRIDQALALLEHGFA